LTSKSRLRGILAVFQFALAIFFMNFTMGLYQQQSFITGYDLGFDKDSTLVLSFLEEDLTADDCRIAKNEILARNDVIGAARTNRVMGTRFWSQRLFSRPEREVTDTKYAKYFQVDYDFLEFYGIDLIEGRGFSRDRPEDIDHAILINESMKAELGVDQPVGQILYTDSATIEIIGVVKDFEGTALDWSYRAGTMIVLRPDANRVLAVKLRPDDIDGSVASIRETWERAFPEHDFKYSFMEDDIRAMYRELDLIILIFGTLSTVSIVIACLGVFGLVSYTVDRRTREIAIRRVLGATIGAVFGNLTRGLVLLVAIASGVAIPLAYWLIDLAGQDYPYQADISPAAHTFGGALTIVLVLAAASYHVVKAARANPTKALRCE